MMFWDGISSKIGVNEVVKGQKQDYVIDKFLGVGSFNNSYLANGNIFLKQYTYPIKKHKNFLKFKNRLDKIYNKINNLTFTENIIETFEYKEHCFIAREYEKNAKTLKKFISQNPPIENRLNLLKKLILPLFEIHKNGIVHTDLKPEQFLILEDKIILIDFDHCIDKGLNIYAPAITNYWYSPEHIKYQNISFHSDVFTFGLIVYKLLTNIHPFYEMIKKGKYEKAILSKKGYLPINEIYQNTLPIHLAKCIDSMLEPDFKNRPTSSEIHEIFTDIL
jgi:serine/threonine protein kinase